jgi:hypothetical protein
VKLAAVMMLLSSVATALPVELEDQPLAPAYPHRRWGFGLGGGSSFIELPPTGFAAFEGRVGVSLRPQVALIAQPMIQLGRGNAQFSFIGSVTVLLEATVAYNLQFALGIGLDYGGRFGSDDDAFRPGLRAAPELQWRFLPSGREKDWDDATLRGTRTSWSITVSLRAPFDGRSVVPQLRLTVGMESY